MTARQRFWSGSHGFRMGRKLGEWGAKEGEGGASGGNAEGGQGPSEGQGEEEDPELKEAIRLSLTARRAGDEGEGGQEQGQVGERGQAGEQGWRAQQGQGQGGKLGGRDTTTRVDAMEEDLDAVDVEDGRNLAGELSILLLSVCFSLM